MLRVLVVCQAVLAVLAVPAGGVTLVLADDPTGVSGALSRIAGLLAGIGGGVAALALVAMGFMYVLDADDVGRAVHLRRGLITLLIGLVLILLGSSIAPHLIQAITGK